jgi:hypothetical protein
MPPARILLGHAEYQFAHLAADPRPASLVRIRPPPREQVAMPPQKCGRCDDPMSPQAARQHASQRREHDPIRPGQPRRAYLAAQHSNLVAQHQQLRGGGALVAAQRRQPAEHLHRHAIDQPHEHDHDPRACRRRLLTGGATEFWHGTRLRRRNGTVRCRWPRRQASCREMCPSPLGSGLQAVWPSPCHAGLVPFRFPVQVRRAAPRSPPPEPRPPEGAIQRRVRRRTVSRSSGSPVTTA